MGNTGIDRRIARPSRHTVGISASLRQDCKTKYIRNSRTISGRLHEELVMMDLGQGKYFSLNPVATRIWDLLGEPLDLEELCKRLMAEYNVSSDQCRADVRNHLNEMGRMGLVTKEEG